MVGAARSSDAGNLGLDRGGRSEAARPQVGVARLDDVEQKLTVRFVEHDRIIDGRRSRGSNNFSAGGLTVEKTGDLMSFVRSRVAARSDRSCYLRRDTLHNGF